MHWKFDIDQRALTRAFDDLTVKSAKIAFPDKYPVKIEFLRGATPFVFTGLVRATIKPVNQQTSGALATSNITVTNTSVAEGILNTNTLQMLDFVKKFGERPVALELLAVDNAGAEVASWTVNCDLSRRYTDSNDIAQDLPSLKASQAEAVAGTDNTKWMTPLRTFQAIAAYLSSGLQVTWAMISGKPSTFPPDSHTHTWSEVLGVPSVFPPSAHTHDDRYYTETETDTLLSGKANVSHQHSVSDLQQSGASVGQVLKWNGSAWAPGVDSAVVEWDSVLNKPSTFTPSSHTHTLADISAALLSAGIDVE